VAGIWSAILLGVAFTAVYAWRVAAEADQLAQALAAAELVIAREQHLSQLDGLAAAAAHELGTPLATVTLVAKEIANGAAPGSQLAEDIALLRQEAARCRTILGRLTTLNEDEGVTATLSLGQLMEEIANPQRPFGVPITVSMSGDGPEPVMRRNPALLYGIGNLVDNAVDFAAAQVRLDGSWDMDRVVIEVSDDGPGFPGEVLLRFGEPYVTTRAQPGSARAGRDTPEGRGGMGLGLFIAKTLLERSGAQVQVTNAAGRSRGARIRLSWPRQRFEAGLAPPAAAAENASSS
jgi:two-component system sensor histidine kinase RegB